MYARLNSALSAPEIFPFTQADLQSMYPGASVPTLWTTNFMAAERIVHVIVKGRPEYDQLTHKAVEGMPVFNPVKGQWEQSFDIVALSADELRARVPVAVSMRQARLALLSVGLLTVVNDAIAAMPGADGEAARIEWEYATEVRRDSPLVAALSGPLNLADADLNQLFISAAGL